MTILVDTDVLIDVALDREPFYGDSAALLNHLQNNRGKGFLAWHSISNFYYMVSSTRSSSRTTEFIAELMDFMTIAPVKTRDMRYALGLNFSDLEDAMQVAAAVACRAQAIATRNVRHYRNSPVPARSPRALLDGL